MPLSCGDTPGHEGTLIGLVKVPAGDQPSRFGDAFRELTEADAGPLYPAGVQVGCTCGWRSERLDVPIDCCWTAAALETSEWFDARGRNLWRAHAIATVFEAKARSG